MAVIFSFREIPRRPRDQSSSNPRKQFFGSTCDFSGTSRNRLKLNKSLVLRSWSGSQKNKTSFRNFGLSHCELCHPKGGGGNRERNYVTVLEYLQPPKVSSTITVPKKWQKTTFSGPCTRDISISHERHHAFKNCRYSRFNLASYQLPDPKDKEYTGNLTRNQASRARLFQSIN